MIGSRWRRRGGRRRRGLVRAGLAAGGALVAAAGVLATVAAQPPGPSGLLMAGIAADPCQPGRVLSVPAGAGGDGARFAPGSSVLLERGGVRTAAGVRPVTGTVAACVTAAETASRNWLAAGQVPGLTAAQRALASRALLDLRLSVRPDGAVVAAWHGNWRYTWPRDASWVAAALAASGHPADALRVLGFLARAQDRDGTWAARYQLDGTPMRDGRPSELDATGWVPWAVWSWASAAGDTPRTRAELRRLWPMVSAAANAAAGSLTGDGLPGPAMDYWENSRQVTLGTAAPLLAGLRAAADLAPMAGADGGRWAQAAGRLNAAVVREFGATGYLRTTSPGSGADAAVTFLGPPFAAAPGPVVRAAAVAAAALRQPDGGLLPGARWTGSPDVAWTAETAFFALFDAGTGQDGQAFSLLNWLAGHRTGLGELPEQVNAAGQPIAVAPLAWTDAVVVLALVAEDGQLTTLPAPASASP